MPGNRRKSRKMKVGGWSSSQYPNQYPNQYSNQNSWLPDWLNPFSRTPQPYMGQPGMVPQAPIYGAPVPTYVDTREQYNGMGLNGGNDKKKSTGGGKNKSRKNKSRKNK